VTIQPENDGPRNWTMVLAGFVSTGYLLAGSIRLFSIQLVLKIDQIQGSLLSHARYEGIVDTIVQLSYSLTSGLIGAVPDVR
jgi:hypothetical protein